jgi:hypothetical protein
MRLRCRCRIDEVTLRDASVTQSLVPQGLSVAHRSSVPTLHNISDSTHEVCSAVHRPTICAQLMRLPFFRGWVKCRLRALLFSSGG